MKDENDILKLFEALNNHEVFTPPQIARDMLDLLPDEIWNDPNIKLLDPCVKSGVFLREAFYRLHEGLRGYGHHTGYDGRSYDLDQPYQRTNHILKNMLFGIATSELTSYVSRRTLYGVMKANSDKQDSVIDFYEKLGSKTSITEDAKAEAFFRNYYNEYYDHLMFNTKDYEGFESQGNIFYPCDEVSKIVDDSGDVDFEDKYFPFIESKTKHKKICDIKEGKMKFDVVIGNPPYQLNIGNSSGNKSKSSAIYHLFINNSIKLNPKYISMITPSRWMTGSSEGISESWIKGMLACNKFMIIHDFFNAEDCFKNVDIKGGVNYFLWNRDFNGHCKYYSHEGKGSEVSSPYIDYLDSLESGIVIRAQKSRSIIDKIKAQEGQYYNNPENNFSGLVSPKDFFTNKTQLTSSWKGYKKERNDNQTIKVYLNKSIHKRDFGWVEASDIPKNINSVDINKVYIPAAAGTGKDSKVLASPFFGESGSICSQTYLVIGFDPIRHCYSKKECKNIEAYIRTKFFRYLVSIKKKTQNGPRGVYQFVPMQDFKYEWTDSLLYEKYNLNELEIDSIESAISELG